MEIIYHYPPELTQLLIDTIPLLSRSKTDVLLFFRGAGVGTSHLSDLQYRVDNDRENINKYEIARVVIQRINEAGEISLRERREILKRVVEFEDYSTCWEKDQLKAKGLVAEIRRVINVKDSFTRMHQEAERSQAEKASEYRRRMEQDKAKQERIAKVRTDLFALFAAADPKERGKKAEAVLNGLFAAYDISIREAFTLSSPDANGIYEQVDGAIAFDGEVYLVEMKWTSDPIGKDSISTHLVRVYHRGYSRGIHISAGGYTEPALYTVREALQKTVFILIGLDEITFLLEQGKNLNDVLRQKVQAAILEKNPYKRG